MSQFGVMRYEESGSTLTHYRLDTSAYNGLIEPKRGSRINGILKGRGRFTFNFRYIPWISAEVPSGFGVYMNRESNLDTSNAMDVMIECKVE